MRESISRILEIDTDDISIKATTTEKMGFVGREEGIVAYAVVLLKKPE
jgi:2-C-methyl-D-erythritol 2,4-cyclodiphosphate synthase